MKIKYNIDIIVDDMPSLEKKSFAKNINRYFSNSSK